MTATLTTAPAHLIAHTVNASLGKGFQALRGVARAYVQANGALRIVATSVAAARLAIGAAQKATAITDEQLCHFEVRLCKTTTVLTFPATYAEAHAQGACLCGAIRATR